MEYTLNLTDEQVEYYLNEDYDQLIIDIENMVDLLDQVDYDEEITFTN